MTEDLKSETCPTVLVIEFAFGFASKSVTA